MDASKDAAESHSTVYALGNGRARAILTGVNRRPNHSMNWSVSGMRRTMGKRISPATVFITVSFTAFYVLLFLVVGEFI